MKVFLLVLAISTTVLGQSPRAPCRVVYANGTIVNNGCFSVGGLIVCEPVDLQYDDIASISFCSPKTCKTNADCSTIDPTSVCTSEPLTPDMDALEALMDSCFPNRPKRPRRQRSVRSEYGRRSNWPLRCSMSADLIVATQACRIDFGGFVTGRWCGGLIKEERCSSEVACTFPIGGRNASLSFCEPQ